MSEPNLKEMTQEELLKYLEQDFMPRVLDKLAENARLKAEVERLTKAGDAMAMTLQADYNGVPYEPLVVINAIIYWNAAKEGKGQP